ncbi:metallothionein-like protein 4B [Prunus yedoensis var. nudiflora]|uniref:Metallothionein-like protein 4B n=1 Tax=Prunus yedoensis var. nudiflora TaxID=2094558 RepID=A0A314UNE5_PRUYE|nr:metallothionein-like protein 4B [Prunus yedoensis var. nudiflora]
MADTTTAGGIKASCNDSCGCPNPCPGGVTCRQVYQHHRGHERGRGSHDVLVRGALWLQPVHLREERRQHQDREGLLQVRHGLRMCVMRCLIKGK